MNSNEAKKHSRSTAIHATKELKLHPEDQNKIFHSVDQESTRQSPLELITESNDTLEIQRVIQTLSLQIKLEKESIISNKKKLRNQILNDFFTENSKKTKKKRRKIIIKNRSTEKLTNILQHTSSKHSQAKLLSPKAKKIGTNSLKIINLRTPSIHVPLSSSRSECKLDKPLLRKGSQF